MSACASCGRRLPRGAAYCGSCGLAAHDASATLAVEIDDGESVADGPEVVLAPARPPRRWVAGGLVGIVVAIVTASMVGGGGGDAAAPTSVANRTTATTATTEAAAATTTTTIPSTFAIGTRPLLGEPTGLALLIAAGRNTYRVDLDAATVTMVDLGSGAYDLQLTPAGLLFRADRFNSAQLWRPGDAGAASLGDRVNFAGAGPAGRAWFVAFSDGVQPAFWYEDTDRVRHDVSLPAGYALPDGVGGLVTDAPGGTYRWTPEPAVVRRISTGRLQAAGGGVVLIAECDEQLRCGDVLLDVRTGERRPAPVAPDAPASRFERIAPDGQTLFALNDAGAGASWSAVGLDGTTVPLGPLATGCLSVGCSFAPHWSPDGQWVVWSPDQTSVSAWRPGLAAPVRITLPTYRRATGRARSTPVDRSCR